MNTVQVKTKQASRHKVLKALYDYVGGVNQESTDCSAERFMNDMNLGIGFQSVKDRLADYEKLGILRRRQEMGTHTNGIPLGRHSHWTLAMSIEDADKLLNMLDVEEIDSYERNFMDGAKRGAEKRAAMSTAPVDKPAFTVRDGIPVEAIVGPDPEPVMDVMLKPYKDAAMRNGNTDAIALIEAARQYRERHTSIDTKFDDLIANANRMGVIIDVDAMRSAIQYDHDERLETVALLIPYIDEMEKHVATLRSEVGELGQLRIDNRKLKQQVERLIAEKVQR